MTSATRTIAQVAAAALLLTGCNSKTRPTPANYTDTINSYFADHRDCLLDGSERFPYETGDPVKIRQMDALVAAQMLEGKKVPTIQTARYTLTDAGTRAGQRFCFGHRAVTSIDSFTPPAPANGFTETTVHYTYTIADDPVWAKTPEVVAAFPMLAEETSGHARGTITLARTGVGWSVPD